MGWRLDLGLSLRHACHDLFWLSRTFGPSHALSFLYGRGPFVCNQVDGDFENVKGYDGDDDDARSGCNHWS